MNDMPYILSVDDEQMNQEIIVELLSQSFNVKTADNGLDCLQQVEVKIPDLILLDVNMPHMDGLATCQKLKTTPHSQDIPVIFLSALASTTERLAGYTAGGDDYLTKPFNEDELIAKINILLKHQANQHDIIIQSDSANEIAMVAMTSAAELGVVMDFMRHTLAINDVDRLKQQILETMKQFGLSCRVLLNHTETPLFFADHFTIRPIEKDVLTEALGKHRVIEFNGGAVFSSKHAALLVGNLPKDQEKYGRFRDHIATLIDAIEQKQLQLIEIDSQTKHHQELEHTVEFATKQLAQVNQLYQEQRLLNAKILGRLATSVEESFLTLGMDQSQEDMMLQLIQTAESQTDQVYEQGSQAET